MTGKQAADSIACNMLESWFHNSRSKTTMGSSRN